MLYAVEAACNLCCGCKGRTANTKATQHERLCRRFLLDLCIIIMKIGSGLLLDQHVMSYLVRQKRLNQLPREFVVAGAETVDDAISCKRIHP